MGCVSSRNVEFPNDVHPNIFTVATVNSNNAKSVYGQLEVTSVDIILHRRGHDPVYWPLHYVRRYGFENNIFSFESGRRCESGPGIFTFRCRRAQELFFLVQTCIQEQRLDVGGEGFSSTARRFSNRPHSANEYMSSANDPTTFVGNSLMNESFNGRILSSTDDDGVQEMAATAADDSESTSQVFMDITPLSVTYNVRNHSRHKSLASTSTMNSTTEPTTSDRPRPHSIEIVTTPTTPPSAVYCNAGLMISSPSQQTASIPNSPPDAYYVNVDPKATNNNTKTIAENYRKIFLDYHRQNNGKNGVKYPSSDTFQRKTPADSRPQSSSSTDSPATTGKAYMNINGAKTKNDRHRALNYVLLDVAAQLPSTPRSAASTAPDFTWGAPLRARRLSNQSSSVGLLRNSGGYDSSNSAESASAAVSNYAKIDCTKTKAVRDTTAQHRLGSSEEWGTGVNSTGRRTRHDSNIDISGK